MANPNTLTVPKKGEVRNPKGRGKGVPNRSTVAREVLAMKDLVPEDIRAKLAERYPALSKSLTAEYVMTIQQVDKAINQQDTAAYKAVMDSAYGLPKQQTEIQGDMDIVFSFDD